MEPWETELREKLNKELIDGPYTIEVAGTKMILGKQGYINFDVQMKKQTNSLKNIIASNNEPLRVESPVTKEMISDIVNLIGEEKPADPYKYTDAEIEYMRMEGLKNRGLKDLLNLTGSMSHTDFNKWLNKVSKPSPKRGSNRIKPKKRR